MFDGLCLFYFVCWGPYLSSRLMSQRRNQVLVTSVLWRQWVGDDCGYAWFTTFNGSKTLEFCLIRLH